MKKLKKRFIKGYQNTVLIGVVFWFKHIKKRLKRNMEKKNPYIGKRTVKKGLKRWFEEDWRNQRGDIGYKYKSDVYRPTKRITSKTPTTFSELSKKEIQRARTRKRKKGRVLKFKNN